MSFGSRLKERREMLHLTQAQLGSKLGVTGGAIGNYEKAVSFPNADILYQFFEVLECDANYLFQDEMGNSDISSQTQLVTYYNQLNTEGQEKLLDYADDLVSSGKYIKSNPSAKVQKA